MWLLFIILVLIIIFALPVYPYSRRWTWYPSGILGLILVVLFILLLAGVFTYGF
jgi:hypothetical protein